MSRTNRPVIRLIATPSELSPAATYTYWRESQGPTVRPHPCRIVRRPPWSLAPRPAQRPERPRKSAGGDPPLRYGCRRRAVPAEADPALHRLRCNLCSEGRFQAPRSASARIDRPRLDPFHLSADKDRNRIALRSIVSQSLDRSALRAPNQFRRQRVDAAG